MATLDIGTVAGHRHETDAGAYLALMDHGALAGMEPAVAGAVAVVGRGGDDAVLVEHQLVVTPEKVMFVCEGNICRIDFDLVGNAGGHRVDRCEAGFVAGGKRGHPTGGDGAFTGAFDVGERGESPTATDADADSAAQCERGADLLQFGAEIGERG